MLIRPDSPFWQDHQFISKVSAPKSTERNLTHAIPLHVP
jgi:hypothetical protein